MIFLSLCMPTRSRQRYLRQSLLSIIECIDKSVEIVVSDNSDNSIAEEIESLSHSIKYFHDNKPMSMHDNFKRCLSHAAGEYVMFLGDDDFVTNKLIEAIEYLKLNSVSCLIDEARLRYWWDDVSDKKGRPRMAGVGAIPRNRGREFRIIETASLIPKICADGGTEINYLPRCYHAITRRDVFEKVKNLHGRYFPGPTPDMAFAMGIMTTCEIFTATNLGFVVSGTAAGSAGGVGLSKQHHWDIDDVPWFDKNELDHWPDSFPRVACGPLLWAAAVINNLKTEQLEHFNYPLLVFRTKVDTRGLVTKKDFNNIETKNFYLKYFYEKCRYTIERVVAYIEMHLGVYYRWVRELKPLTPRQFSKL